MILFLWHYFAPAVRSQCSCEITMKNSQLFPSCIQVQTNGSPNVDQSGSASLSFRSTHPSVVLIYYWGWQLHWRKIIPNLWQNARGTFKISFPAMAEGKQSAAFHHEACEPSVLDRDTKKVLQALCEAVWASKQQPNTAERWGVSHCLPTRTQVGHLGLVLGVNSLWSRAGQGSTHQSIHQVARANWTLLCNRR